MRVRLLPLAFAGFLIPLGGCVEESHHYHDYHEERVVVVDEPPPTERVYIYERGYPPGAYRHGEEVWYEGRSYHHDVFVKNVVNVNIHENRYVNVEENRRTGRTIEQRHVETYKAHQANPTYVAGRKVEPKETVSKTTKVEHTQVKETKEVTNNGKKTVVEDPKKKKKNPNDPNEK
jgi:hypothetical protein